MKTNPLSKNRLNKLAKKIIDESEEDRTRALAAFDYFKDKVDTFHTDELMEKVVVAAEKCMVDSLCAINESRTKMIKALELLNKLAQNTRGNDTDMEADNPLSFEDLDA